MKLLLFLLLFCSLTLEAQPLIVDETFVTQMSGPFQSNYEDVNRTFTPQRVQLETNLKSYPKHFSSYSKSLFWSTFDLRNTSDEPTAIVLRNLRAGTDKIDVYLYRKAHLSEKILLGDLRPQNQRMLLSPKSAFYVTLAPHETISIVSRFESLGSYDLQWEVSSTRYYSYSNSYELLTMGLFGGLIITLIFYNLTMYFHLKKTVFLAYIVHAALLLWFQYAYNGIVYFLNIGIDLKSLTLSTWFVPHFMLVALGIFTVLFFEFHRNNRVMSYSIGSIVGFNGIAAVVLLYAYWDSTLLLYSNYFLLFAFLTLLVYFLIGIYTVYRRYSGGWYYLLGEGTYLFSLIYLTFVLAGKTPTGYMIYLVPASVLIEMVAFSLALNNWVKKLRIENEQTNQLIMDEARFTVIGKSIGMAVHQWKDPLSQLGSHIVYLKAKEYEGEPLSADFSNHINAMSELIEHMKHTVNDVYESCTDLKSFRTFHLYESIDLATRFLKDRLTIANVTLTIDVPSDNIIYGSKNALTNVLMTLINNSITQFETVGTLSPTIHISVTSLEKASVLYFEDNGGGISISNIAEVFDIDTSSKEERGTGMGLALAKLLVEKRLNGTIDVHNTSNGACFKIVTYAA